MTPGQCARCDASFSSLARTARPAYCRTCSGVLDAVIARWAAGDRDLDAGELGAELGLTGDAVSQRARRIAKRHQTERAAP